MIRGLAQLAAVLPQGHADRAEILHALRLGLKTRNAEILSRGVMNKDKAIEALLLVNRVFQDDAEFLRETQSTDALQAIGLLVSEESRRGKAPLSPGEWGKFLEWVTTLPADPNRRSASSSPPQPSALERYRLWRARDAAIKRRDERAIVKFIEINRAVSEAKSWDAGQEQELRRLLEQIEERLALPSVTAIPTDLTERDFPFAVPKREHRDVRFASSSGVEAKFQSLDVYAPMQGTRQPIVVWIHGGGMKGGDKADPGVVVLKPDFFVARGWVFASINYRLAPDHKHPAQAEDTAAALAYLHDHAEEFGADRGRMFVIGISAGANSRPWWRQIRVFSRDTERRRT